MKGCSLSSLMIFVALMISPIFRSKFVIEQKRHDFVDCSSILADHTKEITGNAANKEKFDSARKRTASLSGTRDTFLLLRLSLSCCQCRDMLLTYNLEVFDNTKPGTTAKPLLSK
ncbi:hypothetical protein BJ166DRAFT_67982 [Pestalotiopsis sp. NC0098]|nr:hypothetical protein BJ166DRAFT_67982 [Pestalotiopsis sp. NC0098]